MSKKRTVFLAAAVLIAGLLLSPGCATKKFVQAELVPIDQKVAGIETAIEENQKRIKEHDERLTSLGTLITEQQSELKVVDGKIEEVKKLAQGKLIAKQILTNNEAKFKFDSAELSAEAKAAVDKFVANLIAENRGVYLEIQGHTDNVGPDSVNLSLGERRAGAVMEYLYKQHRIPLHRMEVISLGSSVPIADNSSREGRGQNRRVEILVYE